MLLALWKHECSRVIADRFTMPEDVEWFDHALAELVEEEFVEDNKNIADYGEGLNRFFVDFLRDAPEATGTYQSKTYSTGTFQSSVFVPSQIKLKFACCLWSF